MWKRHVCRFSGETENGRGILAFQDLQAFRGLRGGLRHLPYLAIGAQQLREFDLLQIILDIPPRVPTGLLGYPLQQQSQDRQRNVGMDAVRGP